MWLLASVAAFATSVLVHAVAMRIIERAGAVAAFVAIGGGVGAALIGYCAGRYGLTAATLAATLTYAFACELYIFLFALVGNSVSFGLLTMLARQPLKAADIAGFYRAEAMIGRRNQSILDVYTLILGAFLLVSPWLFSFAYAPARIDAWVAGLIVVALAAAALIAFDDRKEWALLGAGVWLLVSPWLFGFPHAAGMKVHIGVGLFIAYLASLELWLVHYDPHHSE